MVGKGYKICQKETQYEIKAFLRSIPDAKRIRNIREHDEDYLMGRGKKPEEWHHSITMGNFRIAADPLSTLEIGGKYFIGGVVNVKEIIKSAENLFPFLFKKEITQEKEMGHEKNTKST